MSMFAINYSRLLAQSPIPCEFKLGDEVVFTNEYGVVWYGYTIIGFCGENELHGRTIHIARGDQDAWWFPHRPSELTLVRPHEIVVVLGKNWVIRASVVPQPELPFIGYAKAA